VYDKLIYSANNDYKILGIIEPGSFFLLKLSALFDSRGYEFLVVMQGLLTFYVFFKFRSASTPYIGLMVYSSIFLLPNFDIIRQNFAVLIILIYYFRFGRASNLISILFHYSMIVYVILLRILRWKIFKISLAGILLYITIIVGYQLLNGVAFKLDSKYGVFALFKSEVSTLVLFSIFILYFYGETGFRMIGLIIMVIFGWNIDIVHRLIFGIWPLFFCLRNSNMKNIHSLFIVLFSLLVFFKNNMSIEVRPLREWNGIWLTKDKNDDIKSQREWEKLLKLP
jgi:hypothetical protein